MKIILTLILLVFLQEQAFSYSRKQVKLTKGEFSKIVKPQLSNIFQDYQTLLTIMSPPLIKIKPVLNEVHSILKKQNNFINSCGLPENINCSKNLLYIQSKIESVLTTLKIPTKNKSTSYTSLNTFREYGLLREKLLNYYLEIFNFHYLYQSDIYSQKKIYELNKNFLELYYDINYFFINQVTTKYQHVLNAYWNGFIRPVSSLIILSSDKEVFIKRLNHLNINWNVFHAYITKRNTKVPKKIKSILNIMHNRWNYILKATLR